MARSPRTTFTAPLVVTLAMTPACVVASRPPPPPPSTGSGPTEPAPPIVTNPPPPIEPAPVDPTPTPTQTELGSWTVFQNRNDKQCYAAIDVKCMPQATCNPPPPRIMEACPDGIADGASLKVKEWNPGQCFVVFPDPGCPPNVACNPPRPQPIACPK
jgi:hypothetical protein